jgi:hypothetical protein
MPTLPSDDVVGPAEPQRGKKIDIADFIVALHYRDTRDDISHVL